MLEGVDRDDIAAFMERLTAPEVMRAPGYLSLLEQIAASTHQHEE